MLVSLVDTWIKRIIKVQRLLKFALFYKASLYESLVIKWNHTEYDMYQTPSDKRVRRNRRTISLKHNKEQERNEGCTSIPVDVKLHYIRKYIQIRMQIYIREYRSFSIKFNSIHQENLKNRWVIQNDIIVEYPLPPNKPMIYSEFTPERMEDLIRQALHDRNIWTSILSDEKNISSRVYRKRLSTQGLYPNS